MLMDDGLDALWPLTFLEASRSCRSPEATGVRRDLFHLQSSHAARLPNLMCQIRDYGALELLLACRLPRISMKWDFLFMLRS